MTYPQVAMSHSKWGTIQISLIEEAENTWRVLIQDLINGEVDAKNTSGRIFNGDEAFSLYASWVGMFLNDTVDWKKWRDR
jgi:hypothetical protein